jgi:hypothetical protein
MAARAAFVMIVMNVAGEHEMRVGENLSITLASKLQLHWH